MLVMSDLLMIYFVLLRSHALHHSPALLPVLDPIHWLREHGPGVFLHGHPEALPRRLRLDPGPNTNPARRHFGEGQRDLRQQQHWNEQYDCQQAAGLWQNPLSSSGKATQNDAVGDKGRRRRVDVWLIFYGDCNQEGRFSAVTQFVCMEQILPPFKDNNNV